MANWGDAERTLVHWRKQPATASEVGDTCLESLTTCETLSEGSCAAADFAGSGREELVEICITLQANLRAATAALRQERQAVKGLRKDLHAERARSRHFAVKLMEAEGRLYQHGAKAQFQAPAEYRSLPRLTLHALQLRDSQKPMRTEHFRLTPRARTRRRMFSSPTQSPRSDCEACEVSSAESGCHTPTASWWYDDGCNSDSGPEYYNLFAEKSLLEVECTDSWWFSEDSTQPHDASERSSSSRPYDSYEVGEDAAYEDDPDLWGRDSVWLGALAHRPPQSHQGTCSALQELAGLAKSGLRNLNSWASQ